MGFLGDPDESRELLIELGHQIGPAGGAPCSTTRLLHPTRHGTGDVDQHHRQVVAAEGVSQRTGALHDLGG